MPQQDTSWFYSLPKEEKKKENDWFYSLPQTPQEQGDGRGQFGLGTATSIGPYKAPGLFTLRGLKEYPKAAISAPFTFVKNIMKETPGAVAGLVKQTVKSAQESGGTPFGLQQAFTANVTEPLVKGYTEDWKSFIKSPGAYFLNQPDRAFGLVLDAVSAGAGAVVGGATLLTKINNIKKLAAGRTMSGASVKSVLGKLAKESGNTEAIEAIGKLPDEAVFKFGDDIGAVYGEGGSVIGKAGVPYTKPTAAPFAAKMDKVSELPETPEWWRNIEREPVTEAKAFNFKKTGAPIKESVFKPIDEVGVDEVIETSRAASAVPQPTVPTIAGGDVYEKLRNMSAPVVGKFNAIKMRFHSPERVFDKHPLGKEIYEFTDKADVAKNKFIMNEAKEFYKATEGVDEGTPLASGLFKLRDNKLTVDELLKMDDAEAVKLGFTPDELADIKGKPILAAEADKFMSEKFDYLLRSYGQSRLPKEAEQRLWSLANSKTKPTEAALKKMGEVEADVYDLYRRKISSYIPHIFGKQELLDFIGSSLAKAQARYAKLKDTRMGPLLKKKLDDLTIALDKAQTAPRSILYDDLPKEIRFRFFERRTGAGGYEIDAIKAYRTYLTGIAKKIFDEPVVDTALQRMNMLPPELREYTRWYLRDYLGMNRSPFDDVYGTVKNLMWFKTLGFNPRSAVVNWTQKINTVADSNPLDSMRGYAMGFTEKGKRLFDETGLMAEVPQKLWEGTPRVVDTPLDRVREFSAFMFNAAEKGNKKHAFLTGYLEGLRKKMGEAEAIQNGIKKAHKTQFRYGRVGMPRSLRGGAGVAFQFWSYPIKQLEFLGKLYRDNPAGLMAWFAMSEGANVNTRELLNTDLSSALGIGINWGEAFEFVDMVSKGKDAKQLFYQLLQVPTGGGIWPYGPGPAVTTAQRGGEAVTNWIKTGDVDLGDLVPLVEPGLLSRVRQAYKAIKEGPDESGKYTIKSTTTNAPTYKESLGDIAKRTFIARPMVETRTQKQRQLEAFKTESYNALVGKISDLYVEGKIKEATELMTKYHVYPSKDSIRAAMERREMTVLERKAAKKPSKKRYPYEQHLEEK